MDNGDWLHTRDFLNLESGHSVGEIKGHQARERQAMIHHL